jgi:hypothetical protein
MTRLRCCPPNANNAPDSVDLRAGEAPRQTTAVSVATMEAPAVADVAMTRGQRAIWIALIAAQVLIALAVVLCLIYVPCRSEPYRTACTGLPPYMTVTTPTG